jgi:colicin import membrane protein
MWDKFISFTNAMIVHALLLWVVIFYGIHSLDKPQKILSIAPDEKIVQARAVDESEWLGTINRLKNDEIRYNKTLQTQQRQLDQNRRQLEKTVTKESKVLDWLHHLKKKEQQRLTNIKQRQKNELRAIEKLKLKKAKQERLRREAEERKREEAYRKALEKAEQKRKRLEKQKRQAEKARLAQKKADAKRKAESKAEAQRKARAAAKKAEQERQARLAKEAARKREAARRKAARREAARREAAAAERERQKENEKQELIQRVMQDIRQKVQNQWIRPRGYYRGLSCVIEIRLKRGGKIKSAVIQQSSGNGAFDHSARQAVYRSSPLPVPNKVFDTFRHFTFTFYPK